MSGKVQFPSDLTTLCVSLWKMKVGVWKWEGNVNARTTFERFQRKSLLTLILIRHLPFRCHDCHHFRRLCGSRWTNQVSSLPPMSRLTSPAHVNFHTEGPIKVDLILPHRYVAHHHLSKSSPKMSTLSPVFTTRSIFFFLHRKGAISRNVQVSTQSEGWINRRIFYSFNLWKFSHDGVDHAKKQIFTWWGTLVVLICLKCLQWNKYVHLKC